MTHQMKKITASAIAAGLILSFAAKASADSHSSLENKSVAILVGDGFHDGEALSPFFYLREKGADVTLISSSEGSIQAYNSEVVLSIETTVNDVEPGDFHALILPGGQGPANLRENDDVLSWVRDFAEYERPIASICHGPQVLASAGLLEGVTTTCIASIEDEVAEAGAEYVDNEVVVDGNFISSRLPGDLPAFQEAIAEALRNLDS